MKKSIVTFCFFLLGFGLSAQSIKVMSYNIHHGNDEQEVDQLDNMSQLLSQNKTGIVGLVEVDSVCSRSFNRNQAKYLGTKTRMYSAFVRHFDFDKGAYGLALLSKYPIRNVERIPFPILTDSTTRYIGMLKATLQVRKGKSITVLLAHFDYRSEKSRLNQSEFVVALTQKISGPVLLMGDFNASPSDGSIQSLFSFFTNSNTVAPTYPSDHPKKKIDYIVLSPSKHWYLENEKVISTVYSDHCPLMSELKYK